MIAKEVVYLVVTLKDVGVVQDGSKDNRLAERSASAKINSREQTTCINVDSSPSKISSVNLPRCIEHVVYHYASGNTSESD